jgi:hypothetical protein
MTFSPASAFNNFVPNDLIIPPVDSEEWDLVLTDYIRYIIDALNSKEIAIYDLQEFANGEIWFNASNVQQPRFGLRKVINFGALPNATIKSVAHGITITTNTSFTHIYATATNPTAVFPARFSVPIPYVNVLVPTDGIEIYVDATNVNIRTTTANWVGFTTCYVVLEYLQN